jgi:1-acylglycerone phosphate reductase
MFDANVFGLFDMITAFTPLLLASAAANGPSRPPAIINTASVLARVPYPFSAAYNASKAAVASYSDALRIELAPLGIKVITVYMGVVKTGLFHPVSFDPNGLYAAAEAGVVQRGRDNMAKGASPEEFARGVVAEVVGKPGLGKAEAIWKGANAFVVWLVGIIGPASVFVNVAESAAGFTKEVKKAIAERGRAVAQK